MPQYLLKKTASCRVIRVRQHTEVVIQPIGAVWYGRNTIAGDTETFDQNLIPDVAAVGNVMICLQDHPFDFGNDLLKGFAKLGKGHWADADNKVGDTDNPWSMNFIELRPEGRR